MSKRTDKRWLAKRLEEEHARERIARAKAEVQRVVATGVCPQCGSPLRRNLSLTGWWQCAQFGTEQFRADPSRPQCNWQGFTS